jgi:hypothetical protein
MAPLPNKYLEWFLYNIYNTNIFEMIYKRSNNSLISISLKEAGARLIFVFLVLLMNTANSSLYAESTNPNIRISYKENVLSIWAKDADLKKVLFELAHETDINVQLPLSLDKKISINRSGISLSEGLEDILKHLDYVILYSGIKDNKPLISKVIVFQKTKKLTTLTDGETQQVNSETQQANKEIQPTDKEKHSANINFYEKQIESLKKRLSKIDENSRRGKKYSERIKKLEKLIEKH